MCSGCSGHFEGGEEWERAENEPAENDFLDGAVFWGQSVEAGGFESEMDGYEVLVGPDVIVERRVIRCKELVFNGRGGIGAEALAKLVRVESEPGSKQSDSWSARDYRTRDRLAAPPARDASNW